MITDARLEENLDPLTVPGGHPASGIEWTHALGVQEASITQRRTLPWIPQPRGGQGRPSTPPRMSRRVGVAFALDGLRG